MEIVIATTRTVTKTVNSAPRRGGISKPKTTGKTRAPRVKPPKVERKTAPKAKTPAKNKAVIKKQANSKRRPKTAEMGQK